MKKHAKHIFHYTFLSAHVAYFGLVWLESHYTYGLIAGALAIATIVGAFTGEE